MAENKTKASRDSVDAYFAAIENDERREDCRLLAKWMAEAIGQPAVMWGSGIVGFGSYHYRYESGREGDMCLLGFSSRKSDISLYGLRAAPNCENLLANLGKHKSGKGCLYIRKLNEVDMAVLEKLIAEAASAKTRNQC